MLQSTRGKESLENAKGLFCPFPFHFEAVVCSLESFMLPVHVASHFTLRVPFILGTLLLASHEYILTALSQVPAKKGLLK